LGSISVVGPGSRRIRIILPDPDPDPHPGHADPDPADPYQYQFQANENVDKVPVDFFPEHFNMLSKILEKIWHI
jgi:hypothetical protein